jgi:hypothetical protein
MHYKIALTYKETNLLADNFFADETSTVRLTQTRMKIHHASSIRTVKKINLRMKRA